MSPLQKRGWLAALGCMASALIAGCDNGATLMLPPEQPGGAREMPAWPDGASPDGASPDEVSPPATDANTTGDGRGAAPLPSDSAGPGAMLPPEGTAPDEPLTPSADPGAPAASPNPADDGSDDPDEPPGDPPPDDPPPDGPAPGDPSPDEPDEPEPIPPDPSEPEPVDEGPAPPRDEPLDPGSDLPASGSDEPPSDEPPSGEPSGNIPSDSNPPDNDSPGGGVGPQSPEIPGGLPSFHISVIGSSTASGFGASSGGSAWASLLEASLSERATTPITVSNLAVGGYTAFDLAPGSGMAGSIDDAIDEKPDLILVALAGSNDLDGTITTEFFISQLVALRDTSRAAGIPAFFMGTLPKNFTDESSRLLVDFDRAMASEFGACWVPGASTPYAPCYIHVFDSLADASLGLAPEFDSGDGQHPNDAGHALLFKAADAIVEPYVCSKTSCR